MTDFTRGDGTLGFAADVALSYDPGASEEAGARPSPIIAPVSTKRRRMRNGRPESHRINIAAEPRAQLRERSQHAEADLPAASRELEPVGIAPPSRSVLHQGLGLADKRLLGMINAMAGFDPRSATDMGRGRRARDPKVAELLTSLPDTHRVQAQARAADKASSIVEAANRHPRICVP